MNLRIAAVAAIVILFARVGSATPPAPGQPFDCSGGGTSSCATDDAGCVSDTAAHLKCASGIGKAFAKAIASVIKCHAGQATMRFKGASVNGAGNSEENCENNPGNSAQGKLDVALSKLASSSLCDPAQLTNAGLEEAVLFGSGSMSLDGQNDQVYCDSTSGAMLIGDDDAGWVPNSAAGLKCAVTVGKMVSKLAAFAIKCHDKMNHAFFKGLDFDEESCEETNTSHVGALDKYNQARDKLAALGICPSCLNSPALNNLSTSVLLQIDAGNTVATPCP